MRRTVNQLADAECQFLFRLSGHSRYLSLESHVFLLLANIPSDFAESLFSFVAYLASSPAGGSMIVGAGIVPLLVQLIQIRLPNRLQVREAGSTGPLKLSNHNVQS